MIKRIIQILTGAIAPGAAVVSLQSEEFLEKFRNTDDSVLIDTRTPQEITQGQIMGALNIDFLSNSFPDDIARLDKSKTYFVYCRSGRRSLKACRAMQNQGILNTINLEGGFLSLQNARLN